MAPPEKVGRDGPYLQSQYQNIEYGNHGGPAATAGPQQGRTDYAQDPKETYAAEHQPDQVEILVLASQTGPTDKDEADG